MCSFDRSLNGRPLTYYKNELVWGEFQGTEVPLYLFFNNARFEQHEGRTVLGSREIDIELTWSSIKQPVQFLSREQEPTVLSVRESIDGLKKP